MKTNREAENNELPITEDEGVGRRDFLKVAGLASVALGTGLSPSRTFAQAASAPASTPAKESNSYKPSTANYMQVHKELVVIDGCTNLTGLDKDPQYLDWYKQGGATAIVLTVSSAVMAATSNVRHQDDTLDGLGFIARLLQTRDDLLLVRSASDVEKAKRTGKLGLFLQFQNAAVVESNLDLVNMYKALGVNVIGLAYNTRNQFANGVTERVDGGLSDAGIALIKRMNEAKVIVDVAHTGTRSGLDAAGTSIAPVILSHSNSREYFASQRNTPNELIKAVAKSGGLVGAVMYPSFVSQSPTPTMNDYVGNIDYLVQLVGIDHVAVASDYTNQISMTEAQQKAAYKVMIDSGAWDKKTYPYDVLTYPQGVETPKTLFNLTDALLARGYKKEDIAKLWGGNWVRVMKVVVG
ncbi:MAG TPA: membrane dipeptidase [Blastocatellia bacterium]|nr:membrane dipeptidase [Blastocatellia bacterium]